MKGEMMTMNKREESEMLRKNGFEQREIDRLMKLRRDYDAKEQVRKAIADHRRLEFVRWLVATGKLTD